MSVATDAGREQRRPLPLLRALLEGAVVVIFVLLIWNNFALRRQQSRAAAAAKSAHGFPVRAQVGAIPATTLDGKRADIDLRASRGVVAIVNPTCDSCRELMAEARNVPGVHVLSVAPLNQTRAYANDLSPNARVLVPGIGGPLGSQLMTYPQVFVIDRGVVVRTCSKIAECR